ncbi:hypothetical protein ABH924_003727 [Arthrobacter sp. GAS37]|uniref:hypothetical protein n=1 Tax=Arthrobacter sp. GAS37 TaxID=3156261 RepID=UPI003833E2B5
MTAIAERTVITQDTGEAIDGVTFLRDYHMNDGYDWLDVINEHGWYAISSWGEDGWDLAQWPYAIITATSTADRDGSLFGLAVYVEGDVICTYYRTQSAQWAEITRHAHYWWMQRRPVDRPKGLTEKLEDLPGIFCSPYRGLFS